MSQHESGLSTLFDTATRDLTPDVSALVDGGASRGRARLRRRRVGATIAAAAAVGVIGAAAVAVPPLADRMSAAQVATDPTGPPTATPTASASASEPSGLPRTFGVARKDMATTLRDLLGSGRATQLYTSEEPLGDGLPPVTRGGHLTWNGGEVTLLVTPPMSPEQVRYINDLPGDGMEYPVTREMVCDSPARCEDRPDGSWLRLLEGKPPVPSSSEQREVTVTSYLPDGAWVMAMAYNYRGARPDKPVGPDPVLTEQQLRELVTNPIWLSEAGQPVD